VLDADQLKSMDQLAGESQPRLATVDAEDDRIVVDARGESGLGALLGSMLSAHSCANLGQILSAARHAGAQPPQ
jgi:hypothetical protein